MQLNSIRISQAIMQDNSYKTFIQASDTIKLELKDHYVVVTDLKNKKQIGIPLSNIGHFEIKLDEARPKKSNPV